MSRARQPPLVTGISPNEGISWTKVTIRGENLGTGPTDLIGKLKRKLSAFETVGRHICRMSHLGYDEGCVSFANNTVKSMLHVMRNDLFHNYALESPSPHLANHTYSVRQPVSLTQHPVPSTG